MTEADFYFMCREMGLHHITTRGKDLIPYVQVINWLDFSRLDSPSFDNVETFLLGKISKAELFKMTKEEVEQFLLSCKIDQMFS